MGVWDFTELILILFIVLIIFGAGKLPQLGEGLGKAIKGFKKSVHEAEAIEAEAEAAAPSSRWRRLRHPSRRHRRRPLNSQPHSRRPAPKRRDGSERHGHRTSARPRVHRDLCGKRQSAQHRRRQTRGQGRHSAATSCRARQGRALALFRRIRSDRIRRIDLHEGTLHNFAGIGETCYSGDEGPCGEAGLYLPLDIAFDSQNHLYICDSGSNRIRKVDHDTGVITTIVGTGQHGFNGDGPALEVNLTWPAAMAFDKDDVLYIADTQGP